MYPQADEPALIQCATQGDMDALGELYRRYAEPVYQFMFYRTRDAVVAEDLTAEVFAQVITAIRRYEERGLPFGAWLFRIARARMVDYFRRQKVRETLPLEEAAVAASGPSPEGVLTDMYFASLLRYLTDEQREVILLRFVAGLNNIEIAEVVGSNHNAVKQMMYRAMCRLREVLGGQEGGTDEKAMA